MTKWTILGSALCATLPACSSSSNGGIPDGGTYKDTGAPTKDTGTPSKDGGKDAAKDAKGKPDAKSSMEAAAPVEAGVARHVLVTYDGTGPTTMFSVSLATGQTDGTITTTDSEAITDTSNASAPFLLNQTEDLIQRIDPKTWSVTGGWSVKAPGDAGGFGSDPYAVVEASPSAAYVLRFSSNVIDVIDATQGGDAGAPTATVDLTSLVQPGDEDGNVDVTAGAYVAATKTLYVVLANIDLYATYPYMGSYYTICGSTTSTVIAIDTTTNMVKSLADGGPGGAIALQGYDPTSAIYDAANKRLLVFEAGCNPAETMDAGPPGTLQQRGVEEVDLTTNTSKILVDTSDKSFPGSFVYIGAHQAVLGFIYPSAAYNWDPTQTALGSPLPNAPDLFDYDGSGNLVGASINYSADGGESTDIVSMSLSSGNVKTLVANAIAPGEGYVGSVGVWPRP